MNENDEDLKDAITKWNEGRYCLEEIADMAREFGKRGYQEGVPVLIQLLEHDDAIIRYNAVKSLGYGLHHRPATEKLLAMLARDSDEDVRDVVAGALNILWQGSGNPLVLQALGEAALHDPDEDVRRSAYKDLLIVNGVPREEHLELLTGEPLSVDPKKVEMILSRTL